VVVTGPSGETREQSVEGRAGSSQSIDTRDPAPPPPPPSPVPVVVPQPTPEPRSFPLIPVLVGVGLTGVSFALPGVMHQRAANARGVAQELGQGHTEYAAARADYESRRKTYRLSYLLPAGLGVATLGVVIYGIVHVSTGPEAEIGFAPIDGGGALSWRGRF
jgi:hypothetical protein